MNGELILRDVRGAVECLRVLASRWRIGILAPVWKCPMSTALSRGVHAVFALVVCSSLAGCGGGGSDSPGVTYGPGQTNGTGATDPIIFSVRESQSFATEGRYLPASSGIGVSYEASSGHYFAVTPANPTPQVVRRAPNFIPQAGDPWTYFVLSDRTYFLIRASGAFPEPNRYMHTNLATWPGGSTAFGIRTKSEDVPYEGTFTYSGFLEGRSEEQFVYEGAWCCEPVFGGVVGTVTLTFNFASGSATITVTPSLDLASRHALPAITGAELVWSRGSSSFYQADANDPQSLDHPISGLFTGPSAEELIGGIRLVYLSPIDGSGKSAVAAFIAKRN